MPKSAELSIEVRAAMVVEYKNGISATELAKKYGCHRNSILYQVKKQQRNVTLRNVVRRGRNRVTSAKDDLAIIRCVKIDPAATQREVQNMINTSKNLSISQTTVHRRLKEHGIKKYTTQKKPFISRKNKMKRIKFAREHLNKPMEFWRNILWTDESIFSLDGTWGRKFFYSKPSEKLKRAIVAPTRHSGGGHIMVWGCISHNGVGPITMLRGKIGQNRYLELLNEVALVAGCKLIGENFILQQDNAPIHKGRMVLQFLKDLDQALLEWPPQSPDLNVIENVCAYIKRQIPCDVGRTEEGTWNDIINAWSNLPTEFLRNLIDSIPRRLAEVLDANGGHTSY